MSAVAVVRPVAVFEPGGVVALWRVRDEGVQSHRGGQLVATAKADDAGVVEFAKGVVLDARYIAFAYVDGRPVEVRAIGVGRDVAGPTQAPVERSVVRHADGQVVGAAGDVYQPRRDDAELVDGGLAAVDKSVKDDESNKSLAPKPAAKPKAASKRRAPRKRASAKKSPATKPAAKSAATKSAGKPAASKAKG